MQAEAVLNTLDFGVDFWYFKFWCGFYPKKKRTRFFEECAIYSRRVLSETYEDRSHKHLYGKHHSCKKDKSLCKF